MFSRPLFRSSPTRRDHSLRSCSVLGSMLELRYLKYGTILTDEQIQKTSHNSRNWISVGNYSSLHISMRTRLRDS